MRRPTRRVMASLGSVAQGKASFMIDRHRRLVVIRAHYEDMLQQLDEKLAEAMRERGINAMQEPGYGAVILRDDGTLRIIRSKP